MAEFTHQIFLKDVSSHQMRVLNNNGINRHLRFKRPNTMCMHFDLITWPGYLCYTGDMGTYVFRRLHDMFNFFRTSHLDRIDYRYWAEKVEAMDRTDGIEQFSSSVFTAAITDVFESRTDDWDSERKQALWEDIEASIFPYLDDGEHVALTRLHEFNHNGFEFCDFDYRYKEYAYRFLWCCHAITWGINVYDQTYQTTATIIS